MARWSDILFLLNKTETVNNGEVVSFFVKTKRYVNKLSIRQKEFYDAHLTGLNPEIMFEIRTGEYNKQPSVEFEGEVYHIIRTYNKGEFTELVVSRFPHVETTV